MCAGRSDVSTSLTMGTNPLNQVIVCGGGMAGLAAALSALEAGAEVILFEKAPEVGGTTLLSGGLIWTFADFSVLREQIPLGDAQLQWLVCDTIDASREWLMEQGVRFGPFKTRPDNVQARSIEPAQAISALLEKFKRLGGTVVCRAGMEGLVFIEDAVRGVRTVQDGRAHETRGAAVVLATGGFQGNPELVSRYIVRDAGNLVLRANPWSTGDALVAAASVGADLSSGLNTFYGHALPAPPARLSSMEFQGATQHCGRHSVAINLLGQRFADESEGRGEEILNQQLAMQPRGRGFYILDQGMLDAPPFEGDERLNGQIVDRARKAGAPLVEADTLEALCDGLGGHGVPAAVLLDELKRFNELILSDRADFLRPSRRRYRTALCHPPFIAVGVQAGITCTLGGLRVDEQMRVVRRAGSSSGYAAPPVTRAYTEEQGPVLAIGGDYRQTTIDGLYAAGCDVGNISNFHYMGALAIALTTGRIAGLQAARRAKELSNG